MPSSIFRFATMVAAISAVIFCAPKDASAQQPGSSNTDMTPRVIETTDQNGWSFRGGGFTHSFTELIVGNPGQEGAIEYRRRLGQSAADYGPDNLPHIRNARRHWQDNQSGYIKGVGNENVLKVVVGDTSEAFSSNPNGYLNGNPTSGSTLEYDSVRNEYIFTRVDGTKIYFNNTKSSRFISNSVGTSCSCSSFYNQEFDISNPDLGLFIGEIQSIERPNGHVTTWHYTTTIVDSIKFTRPQAVTNNFGWRLHFEYQSNTITTIPAYLTLPSPEIDAWMTRSRAIAINDNDSSQPSCAPTAFTCSGNWPSVSYASSGLDELVTDTLGRTTRYTFSGTASSSTLVAVTSPEDPTAQDWSVTGSPSFRSLTTASGTWTYTWQCQVYAYDPDYCARLKWSVAGPNGYSMSLTTWWKAFTYDNTRENIPEWDILEVSDAPTKRIDYDTLGRVTTVKREVFGSLPEQITTYSYQGDGSCPIQVSTAVSGLPTKTIAATYKNGNLDKDCTRPLSITDELGRTTNYTYHPHGAVATITHPAPGSGPYASVRPQTRFSYSPIGPDGIDLLTSTSSCSAGAAPSCLGGANETRTDTAYGSPNFLPTTTTTKSGNGAIVSQTTTAYTRHGDIESLDGPLSGAADTTRYFYDDHRQLRAEVGPDPDGAGPLLHRATRTTYNDDGLPTETITGAVSSPSSCAAPNFCGSMAALAKSTTDYDTFGRKSRMDIVDPSSGTPFSVTQYNYEASGRVSCEARRMDPATFSSLPDACSQTSGNEDRITKTTYTANGDISKFQKGLGTPLQIDYRTATYLVPGSLETLKDANNNLTTYEYDGFLRLLKARYPVAALGANASSTTDYEQFTYDAVDNIVSERRRDGRIITNTWDNLNRLRFVNFPSGESDVTNAYDNLNRLITSSQSGATGVTVSQAYDALGRMTSETQASGTVSYLYDPAGRRTRTTWPGGGLYVTYDYLTTNELLAVRENGGAALATHSYDNLGRRVSLVRGNGVVSSYGYNSASWLTDLDFSLPTAASYDQQVDYTYNPVRQIISKSASNDDYLPQMTAISTSYGVNGLNQTTSVGGVSTNHDGRGNMTNDGSNAYRYDSQNRMIEALSTTDFYYDASGRLHKTVGAATTQFLYDGADLIAELDGAGNVLRRYVHGGGVDDPLVWYEGSAVSSASRRYLVEDERGSIALVTDSSGGVIQLNRYDEYGVPDPDNQGRFQYTGQTWFPEAQLYHYKARMYHPELGRFMQTDPIGYEDQINLYAYVHNDPVNFADPSGMQTTVRCEDLGDGIKKCSFEGGTDAEQLAAIAAHLVAEAAAGREFVSASVSGPAGTPGIGHNGGPDIGDDTQGQGPEGGPPSVPALVWPENDSQIKHIFADRRGHFSQDTLENRRRIEAAVKPENFAGRTVFGVERYLQKNPDGTEIWVSVRNGRVENGGINYPHETRRFDFGR